MDCIVVFVFLAMLFLDANIEFGCFNHFKISRHFTEFFCCGFLFSCLRSHYYVTNKTVIKSITHWVIPRDLFVWIWFVQYWYCNDNDYISMSLAMVIFGIIWKKKLASEIIVHTHMYAKCHRLLNHICICHMIEW